MGLSPVKHTPHGPGKARPGLLDLLRLARTPLAPTAVADVLMGHYVALPPAVTADTGRLTWAIAASLLLYSAGMILNDAFDAARDLHLHPDRPIPAERVSRRAAFGLGLLLLLLGATAGGLAAGPIGLILPVAILLYDGLLKHWRLPGAVAMATCRVLNVWMGAGGGAPPWPPLVAIGTYILAVTLLSTFEDTARHPTRIRDRVRRALLGLFLLDALLLALYKRPLPALVALGLLLPSVALTRWVRTRTTPGEPRS